MLNKLKEIIPFWFFPLVWNAGWFLIAVLILCSIFIIFDRIIFEYIFIEPTSN